MYTPEKLLTEIGSVSVLCSFLYARNITGFSFQVIEGMKRISISRSLTIFKFGL